MVSISSASISMGVHVVYYPRGVVYYPRDGRPRMHGLPRSCAGRARGSSASRWQRGLAEGVGQLLCERDQRRSAGSAAYRVSLRTRADASDARGAW